MGSRPIGPGTSLGRYVVQEYLRQSTLGPVYRASDPALSRSVAVTVLEGVAADPDAPGRFRTLGPQLVRLNHPNITDVFEYGEHDGAPYLISQIVPGPTLADRLMGGRLGQDDALRLLRGVGAGIDYLHTGGVMHGDLKPGTVLIGPGEQALVTDYGLVPLLGPSYRRLTPEVTLGDPLYTAPEDVTQGALTPATDRYAFATLAYQLITGSAPFEGRPAAELLGAQEREEPPRPSTRNPALGPATDSVLLRGLAKNPGARWTTCAQLTDRLVEALQRDSAAATAPVLARAPAPAVGQGGGGAGRWALGALAVVAIAAVAALLYASGFGRPSPTPSPSPSPGTLRLSVSSVTAGGTVLLSASNLPANQVGTVDIQSDPVQVDVFSADQFGNVTKQVTIPADTVPGGHLVSLCWGGTCPVTQAITVLQTPQTPTPTATPTHTPSITATITPTHSPTHTPSTSPVVPPPLTPTPTH
jgi:serine/threonine-protein kinase